MRGKVRTDRIATDRDRITPAYAGKSVWLHWSTGAGEDHPRLCGEKLCHFCKILFRPGSPPPMRGKGTDLTNCGYWKRITPAYAGKSLHLHHIYSFYQDHPRLCGEKYMIDTKKSPWEGSPPPMRGKVSQADQDERGNGITPAYAGKSAVRLSRRPPLPDHPRLCGEKGEKVGDAIGGTGSPPPMRGKVAHRAQHHAAERITPAYAGKRLGF